MTIIRISKRETGYTVIDNIPLNDFRLSWTARGLLAYLLSKPNNWEISLQSLMNEFKKAAESIGKKPKEGRYSCTSAINELEEFGYLERTKIKNEKGRFIGWQSVVYEQPRSDFPILDKSAPRSGFPTSENLQLISTEYNNKNITTNVVMKKDTIENQKSARSTNRKILFPKDFEVTQEHMEYARKKNLPSPRDEFDKFKEHHLALGNVFSNWNMALYKWLRNAKEFKEKRNASSRRNVETNSRQSKVDIFERANAGAFDRSTEA